MAAPALSAWFNGIGRRRDWISFDRIRIGIVTARKDEDDEEKECPQQQKKKKNTKDMKNALHFEFLHELVRIDNVIGFG